jgi:hypothetical protein
MPLFSPPSFMRTGTPMKVKVEGPITGGTRGRPFAGSMLDIEKLGYQEEEYLLSGIATGFHDVENSFSRRYGLWTIEPTDESEFCTRLLIYRPRDPRAFNGSVVLLWNNVSVGHDLFGADSLELFENGSALACLTVQKAGIEGLPPLRQGLAQWDPDRYGALTIASDYYSFDIFTQAARTLGPYRDTPIDPLAGLPVKHVIAQGASQSASRLATYINAIQPVEKVLDGFILSIYFGQAAPIEVGDEVINMDTSGDKISNNLLMGRNLIRDDLGIPIFIVNSELEAMACYNVRQPDTATFRYWESAGTSHSSRQGREKRKLLFERDQVTRRAIEPGVNEIPMDLLYDAVFYHMQQWVAQGIEPPIQPKIEFKGNPPEIVRDNHGIAVGGIRLPQVVTPLATNSAVPLSADLIALLAGSCFPFAAEKIQTLYVDKQSFITRFEAAAETAMRNGVLRPRDIPKLVAEAEQNWPLEQHR